MRPADGESVREVGEKRVVERFRRLAAPSLGSDVLVGPGDDAAVLTLSPGSLLLLACDMMVEGVHFRRDWASPWQIGWKAMVQNLSDIAAMGGEPRHAVASVGAPGDLAEEGVQEIARGLVDAAAKYGAALVGGDLVGSPGPLVVDVALTGRVEKDRVLLRRGAEPGDAILVTGALGAAGAGLEARLRGLSETPAVSRALRAHHEPRPRLAEARAIAAARTAGAMMDLSDGLAEDLPRLCAESGVGARVYADRIPVDRCCAAVARELEADPLSLAVTGGEDYELLLTCRQEEAEKTVALVRRATGTQVTAIGEVLGDEDVLLTDADGSTRPLGAGFDHFAVGEQAVRTGLVSGGETARREQRGGEKAG